MTALSRRFRFRKALSELFQYLFADVPQIACASPQAMLWVSSWACERMRGPNGRRFWSKPYFSGFDPKEPSFNRPSRRWTDDIRNPTTHQPLASALIQ
eukprot:1181740-Prorocentrum_minimum.AAC.5